MRVQAALQDPASPQVCARDLALESPTAEWVALVVSLRPKLKCPRLECHLLDHCPVHQHPPPFRPFSPLCHQLSLCRCQGTAHRPCPHPTWTARETSGPPLGLAPEPLWAVVAALGLCVVLLSSSLHPLHLGVRIQGSVQLPAPVPIPGLASWSCSPSPAAGHSGQVGVLHTQRREPHGLHLSRQCRLLRQAWGQPVPPSWWPEASAWSPRALPPPPHPCLSSRSPSPRPASWRT